MIHTNHNNRSKNNTTATTSPVVGERIFSIVSKYFEVLQSRSFRYRSSHDLPGLSFRHDQCFSTVQSRKHTAPSLIKAPSSHNLQSTNNTVTTTDPMTNFINNSFSQSTSNEESFVVALALAGFLGRVAFDAAHHHIISRVETPPPQQLYPAWLSMNRRRQAPKSYPQWYDAYKNLFDTYLALMAAREKLEAVMMVADAKARDLRKTHVLFTRWTVRELALEEFCRTGRPFYPWEREYNDLRDEVSSLYDVHRGALEAFKILFQFPQEAAFQIISFVSPDFALATEMKDPTDELELKMKPLEWEVRANGGIPNLPLHKAASSSLGHSGAEMTWNSTKPHPSTSASSMDCLKPRDRPWKNRRHHLVRRNEDDTCWRKRRECSFR